MTFDAQAELQRAAEYVTALTEVNGHEYDPSDPKSSHTLFGVTNYLVGVVDAISSANQDTPLQYPEDVITGLIDIAKKKPRSLSLNLPEEEDRARAFYDLISAQPYPAEPEEVFTHIMTIGILTGIVNALSAVQGKTVLDYEPLIPSTPEGLTDDDA